MRSTRTLLLTSSKTNSKRSIIIDNTFTALSNFNRLLPTGTVFVYQFLSRFVTLNKYLTSIFIAVCGLICGLSCFTDTYKISSDGTTTTHHGIATLKGLWPSGPVDLSSYRLSTADFIHAFFVMSVFAVVALLDPNTVKCLYPSLAAVSPAVKDLFMVSPVVVGAVSATVFVVFPNKRRWIGYHL